MLALHAVVLRWGRGAVGSAPRWHRGGRGFESHRLHQNTLVFFLYILKSESTGRFYIGQTQDVSERLTYHNANYSKSLKAARGFGFGAQALEGVNTMSRKRKNSRKHIGSSLDDFLKQE